MRKCYTYINEEIGYVYVPIGIFNLQETPTTSKGITTIKARDNSVKFDINYNAKPLIDGSETTTTDSQGNFVIRTSSAEVITIPVTLLGEKSVSVDTTDKDEKKTDEKKTDEKEKKTETVVSQENILTKEE